MNYYNICVGDDEYTVRAYTIEDAKNIVIKKGLAQSVDDIDIWQITDSLTINTIIDFDNEVISYEED